jgi:putative ABC transport system permease protein
MRSRRWTTGWDPVWTRAPFVLLRYPGLLAALAAGALLLSLTVAAFPMFLSASASRLLRTEMGAPLVGRYGAGITYENANLFLEQRNPGDDRSLLEARTEVFAEITADSPSLAPAETSLLGPPVSLNDPEHPQRIRAARLFAGAEALQHVEIVEGEEGPGVWIPDVVARGLRLGAGDRIRLSSGDHEPMVLPVDGVYRTLASTPPGGYWLAWEPDIYPTACMGECAIPPQFLLVEEDRLLELAREDGLGDGQVTVAWQAPVRRGLRLGLDDARELSRFATEVEARIRDPATGAGRVLDCCHGGAPFEERIEFRSSIDHVVDQTERRTLSLEGPSRVLRWAGILVALAVLASAGVFSAGARSTEVRLLAARGTGPVGAGGKAALEAVAPSVAGGAVGLVLAFLFVRAVAGSSPPSPSSIRTAILAAGFAVVASIAALGAVAALTSVRHAGHHHGRLAFLARVPWEIGLLAFAAFAAARLPAGLGSSEVALDVSPPSPYLLLFPVAFVGGFAGLGARLFREGFRSLRNRGGGRRKASYLALHRLAGAPLLPLLLVGAAGMCLGVFVQGQALARSLEFTVDAKAKLFVGSDVRAWINPDSDAPDDFPLPVTRAARARQAGTADPGGASFDLLGVDPSTLAGAAFWSGRFADTQLEDLAGRLDADGDGPVPVVIAAAPGFEPTALEMNQQVLPVEVVGRAEAFPGMVSRRPLVVIDAEAVARAYPGTTNPLLTETATTELWVRGDPDRALDALADPRIAVFQSLTADRVKQLPRLSVVIDTFSVLDALGLATGVLVVAALLMYLQARQRSQIVAYGLSTRMGMSPAGHRRAVALETGSMLLAAFVLGVGLGLAAAAILVGRLDPLPVVPPDPLLVFPVVAIVAALVVVIAAAWLGAWLTSRQAASVRLGEVMRVAE